MTVYSYSSGCPSSLTRMEKRAGKGDLGDKETGSLVLSLLCLPWQKESWEGTWQLYINVKENPVEIEVFHGIPHSHKSKWEAEVEGGGWKTEEVSNPQKGAMTGKPYFYLI